MVPTELLAPAAQHTLKQGQCFFETLLGVKNGGKVAAAGQSVRMLIAKDVQRLCVLLTAQRLSIAVGAGVGHHHGMRTQSARKELVVARLLGAHTRDDGTRQRMGITRASAQYVWLCCVCASATSIAQISASKSGRSLQAVARIASRSAGGLLSACSNRSRTRDQSDGFTCTPLLLRQCYRRCARSTGAKKPN